MNTKIAGIILIILTVILCTIVYLTYPNIEGSSDNSITAVGSSKVCIPQGYDIQKITDNGVLFANFWTNIGIYEVSKGNSFDKKVDQMKKKYGNNYVSTYSYTINDTILNTIIAENPKVKIKETYFEKNGVKYHIYEKGVEDKTAFNTLFNSISK
ncbi:MAG: hypothetical protein BZ137_01960 [Methanosphaera sp. rholeuAM130]|nr:MAG: hypothetical protein BZ137_01960 [Methanosphaera sp. rholeuAM130]